MAIEEVIAIVLGATAIGVVFVGIAYKGAMHGWTKDARTLLL